MAGQKTKLTKSVIDKAKPGDADFFIWDTEVSGFGLKVGKGGKKSFVLQYRAGSGRGYPTRRFTIGAYGSPWLVDQARKEAMKQLGRVANGEDPAKKKQEDKKELTVDELCDLYLKNGTGTKKPSTLATDKGRIERHIKPLLGKKRVSAVSRADVRKFLADVADGKTATDEKTVKFGRALVKGGKGTATRTVGLLGGIFSYAFDLGLIEINPVRGVKRYVDKRSERFLSQKELVRLGKQLDLEAESKQVSQGVAIIRLLIFTGARRGEIEGLKWSEVDADNSMLRLEDSKTGQKNIPLNASAREVISKLPKLHGSQFVFPATKGDIDGFFQGTPRLWRKVREKAKLDDVRLHDLRHSFASVAVAGGASLPMIGALLGHKDSATTQRYAHLADDPLKAATEAIGSKIASSLKNLGAKEVHDLNRKRG